MTTVQHTLRPGLWRPAIDRLNTSWHERALWLFMVIVLGHWLEHLAQAYQIWVAGMPRSESLGALGLLAPWLVTSELMHFGFAVSMLAGLWYLRYGFTGSARTWWNISLAIQGWHFVEHAVLQGQAAIGLNLFSGAVPTSILQPLVPRAELHLLYNAAVFIPMVVAMWLHSRSDQPQACTCSKAACVNPGATSG